MPGHAGFGENVEKIKHIGFGTDPQGEGKIRKIFYHDGTAFHQVWSGASVVTYHVDSGVTETREVDEGLSVLTYTPTKSGWTFLGWRDDSTASSSVHTTKVATGEPMTLYAVFYQNITVTYYNNSTSASTSTKQRYYNNGNIVNPSFALTEASVTSWSPRGWSTTNTGNASITYNNGATFTRDSNITLYSLYSRTVTVSYNGNGQTGGSTAASTGTAYRNASGTGINASITLRSSGFSKTNYTFYRWRTGASSGTIYSAGGTYSSTSDITLYAYWIVTTTSFNYTGGMQSFTMLAGVTYLCKVWGAQGGGFTIDKRIDGYMRVETYDAGGKGGYAQGNKKYASNTTVYIGVGGKPAHNSFKDSGTTINNGGYNGGGKAGNDNASGSGGGATHIGLSNAVLASTNSSNVLLVAGGGGGCAKCYLSDASYSNPGGYGGGASGQNGQQQVGNFGANFGYGGTQTAGGSRNGAYGKGGSASDSLYAAGGGGGYYGGGAGYTYNGASAGGGGSGYIGGVTNGSTSGNSQTGNGYAQIVVSAVS